MCVTGGREGECVCVCEPVSKIHDASSLTNGGISVGQDVEARKWNLCP